MTTPTKEELVVEAQKAWVPGIFGNDDFELLWLAQQLANALAENERLLAQNTAHEATISLLGPACNHNRDIAKEQAEEIVMLRAAIEAARKKEV